MTNESKPRMGWQFGGKSSVTSDAQEWPVFVADCDVGCGLFAATDLRPDDRVLRFTGPRISLAEALTKGVLHCNPLQVAEGWYIDLEEPGVFVNHSCEPNAGIIDDIMLVALRPIRRGEEVRFDYSTSMADGTWELECRCGALACRRLIRDFKYLPPKVQHRYLAFGVVQRFIAQRFAAEGRR